MNKKIQDDAAPASDISEADRMAKIRELLVSPVVADEAARTEQSINRLEETANIQRETIASLQGRIDDLEQRQRADVGRLRARLFGLVEAMLVDDEELRARLMRNDTLRSAFQNGRAEDAD
jgi:hypothetical protein